MAFGIKKRRRVQIISIAAVCLFGVLTILWFLPKDSFQYFKFPSQVSIENQDPNEVFKIGGMIEKGSVVRGQGETVTFRVADATTSISVSYKGILPDLFEEGQTTVVTGKLVNNIFEASVVLAKHDENYIPKELVGLMTESGELQPANGN